MTPEDNKSFLTGRLRSQEQVENYLMVWGSRHGARPQLQSRLEEMARDISYRQLRRQRWVRSTLLLVTLTMGGGGLYFISGYPRDIEADQEKHEKESPTRDPVRGCDFESTWALRGL